MVIEDSELAFVNRETVVWPPGDAEGVVREGTFPRRFLFDKGDAICPCNVPRHGIGMLTLAI